MKAQRLIATLVALLLSSVAPAEDKNNTASIDDGGIAPQALDTALEEFAERSGLQVIYLADVAKGKQSPGAEPDLSDQATLDQLLSSTDLEYEFLNDNTVTLQAVAAEGGDSDSGNASPAPILMVRATASQEQTAVSQSNEDATEAQEEESIVPLEEIIVTGTNIRGIAPESSPTITFDREDIDQSGFLTTDEFIRSVPQNFGGGANNVTPLGIPGDIESASNNILGAGVNIRGLGAGATLTLLNGRRLAPAGSDGGFVDVSSIPLSAVERVELLTDGASSIYGGDAVAGVANFVLREDFEGAETSITYGGTTEGDREEIRLNQLLGTNWSSGSAFVSYEFLDQNLLLARDKDFTQAAPDPLSLLPGQERHSLIASLTQELTPNLEFGVTGYYADRFSESIFNRPAVDLPVQFEEADTEQFLIAPSLTYQLPSDWRIVLAGDYSETKGDSIRSDVDKMTGIREEPTRTRNENEQSSVDVIADGPFFQIPGGDVKLAIGGAFRTEDLKFFGTSSNLSSEADRDVWAGFAEVFVPIVGDGNASPGVERLELSTSVRYDDYSDFGSSTNPKIGLLWSPVGGLSLRGSYSTSFNPPDLGLIGNPDTSVVFIPTLDPDTQGFDLQYLWLLGNDVTNIQPEESESLTFGIDYEIDVLGGELRISNTYYNIEFDDQIALTPFPPGLDLFNVLASEDQLPPDVFIPNPTREQVDFLIGLAEESGRGAQDFVPLFTGMAADLDNLDFIFNFQTRNIASTTTDGIDFEIDYSKDFGDSSLNVGFAGDYIFDYSNQATPNSPEIEAFNRIFTPVDFRARGWLNWSDGQFSTSAFVNYTDGYTNDRVDPEQSIDPWTTIDINFTYRFKSETASGLLDNVRTSINVRNLFDDDPPFVEASDAATVSFFDGANANPLGRFISVNIVKSW